MDAIIKLIYLWLALFGACIGSFINVVVYRVPKGTFLSKSRSFCPQCEKALSWRDLIPVFSWLTLRGRCRYCSGRVSRRYPAVEMACAGLAVLSFASFGDLRAIPTFGISAILLAIALIDHDTMEIPNGLIIALVPFALLAAFLMPEVTPLGRGIGFFAVSLPMLALTLAVGGAFGGGDIKLAAVCGFLLGWQNMLLAFFLALLTGGGYAVYLLISRKRGRKEQIAFGPHLCLGTAIALFWGSGIIRWYLSIFNITGW